MSGRKLEQEVARRRAALLCAALRKRRDDLGLSQEELARRARLSTATIRSLERKRPPEPRFFTVIDIARGLQIRSRELAALIRRIEEGS